jgi:predicted kinase
MNPTVVVLITGHPATGKTTLGHYLAQELCLPLICRDHIKEMLLDTLGWSTPEWSRQLSVVSWGLLYQQVEILLRASVTHIVESNFDPTYADGHWQALIQRYPLRLIQVRCEADPEILLDRYRERIEQGARHPGHVDQSDDLAFHELIKQGPMAWIKVESERVMVNTGELGVEEYTSLVGAIQNLMVL